MSRLILTFFTAYYNAFSLSSTIVHFMGQVSLLSKIDKGLLMSNGFLTFLY